jgi:hypothetical protein
LTKTGVFTSLRRLFAKTRVNECNRDFSPSTKPDSLFPNQPNRSQDRHQDSEEDQDESKSKSWWVQRFCTGHRATDSSHGESKDDEQYTNAQPHPVRRHNRHYHLLLNRSAVSFELGVITIFRQLRQL